jgi:hypothetical protein
MIGSPIARLLKLAQSDGVGAHQRQNRQTEHYEYDVEHDRLLAEALLSPSRRKLSIANWAAGRKDSISFSRSDKAGRDLGVRMSRRSDAGEGSRSERAVVGEAETCRIIAAILNIIHFVCIMTARHIRRCSWRKRCGSRFGRRPMLGGAELKSSPARAFVTISR